MKQKKRKNRIQINYRSGISVIARCVDFRVERNGPMVRYHWEDMQPDPIDLCPDNIESVWLL